jgi:hypothetical protein
MKSWNIIGQIMGTVTLVYFHTGALYIIVAITAIDIVVSLHIVILIYRWSCFKMHFKCLDRQTDR